MPKKNKRFYIWNNNMCITYLLELKKMENFLIANGLKSTDDPAESDIIIIGACASFIPWFDLYKKKIKTILPLKKKLVVYGCLPIVDRKFFEETTPQVDSVIPTRHPERIEKTIENLKVPWFDIPDASEFRRSDCVHYIPHRKFIAIQHGCSEKCVFCPHRISIGPEKSHPEGEIVEQVRREVAGRARIIYLEGSNGGSWGLDLMPKKTFLDLLEGVNEVIGESEIHIGNFSSKWIVKYGKALKKYPKVTEIKIPIQSSSPRLLKLMGRDHHVQEISPILKELRKSNKRLVLRTEIIIGLPTETEKEFLDSLNFTSEHFDLVACFSYDFHPKTRLARMGLPFLDDSVLEKRVRTAMEFFSKNPQIKSNFVGGRICLDVVNKVEKQKIYKRVLGNNFYEDSCF